MPDRSQHSQDSSIVFTPIENVLQASCYADDFAKSYVGLLRGVDSGRYIDTHKNALGLQAFVFTSEFRYYVWETKLWRVFVSRGKGISFEVPEGISIEQAWVAWRNYANSVWHVDVNVLL